MEPLLTDTSIIRTPLYYGQFTWSLRDRNPYQAYFSKMDTSIIQPNLFISDTKGTGISVLIIWLAPRAGKMSQILRCDWLPERARWSYLARSGLPVARPLGIERLIPTTMQSFLRFSRCFGGKRSLKSSVNFLNIYLKERKENGVVLV